MTCSRGRTRSSTLGVVAALLLTAGSGCSALRPDSFASFDDWLTGEPESDYEIVELDGRSPQVQLVHHYLLWPGFAARDGARLAAAPLVAPYFMLRTDSGARPDGSVR